MSFQLVDAMRRVLLGNDPRGVKLSKRALQRLENLRSELVDRVDRDRTVLLHASGETRWWTWAGSRANAVLWAALYHVVPEICEPTTTFTNDHVAIRADASAVELRDGLEQARKRFGDDLAGVQPEVSDRAIQDLKFSEMLPEELAVNTLAARLADPSRAADVLARAMVERFSAHDAS